MQYQIGIQQFDKYASQDLNLQSPVSETDALSTHNVKLAAIIVSLHCTLSTEPEFNLML